MNISNSYSKIRSGVLAGAALGGAVWLPRLWTAQAAPPSATPAPVVLDAQGKRVTAALTRVLHERITGQNMQLRVVPSARAGAGYFSEVYIAARPGKIKDLPVTELALRSRNVRLDVARLLQHNKVDTFAATTTLRAVITENDLDRMFAQGKHTASMNLKAKFLGNRLRVAGNWSWALLSGPVVAVGRLYLAPGNKVDVEVISLKLNGAEVPQFVKNKFSDRLNPLMDYNDVPFRPRFKGVKVIGDRAIITA